MLRLVNEDLLTPGGWHLRMRVLKCFSSFALMDLMYSLECFANRSPS